MKPNVVWVSGTNLESELGAASWLETTKVLRDLGWNVTLISEGSEGWRTIRGIQVYCVRRSRHYFLGSVAVNLSILRYVIKHRTTIDILLFHQMTATWIFALKFLFGLVGWKFPVAIMDTRDIPKYGHGVKFQLRERFFKLSHVLANWFASGQTAITPKMAEFVKIPPNKLLGTWPSGVTMDHFSNAIAGRTWPILDGPVHLIYIGELHFERNLLPLCTAIVQANKSGLAFRLTLLGDGLEREILQDFAGESDGGVVVKAHVSHTEVPDFLEKAHIGVTPLPASNDPKFEFSSPIKMFEYMASGMPVLTTRNICHLNVVQDGTYAFWADDGTVEDLAEPLQKIWERRMDLESMGQEAAKAVVDWTWEASAKKLSQALLFGLRKNTQEEVVLDLKEAER